MAQARERLTQEEWDELQGLSRGVSAPPSRRKRITQADLDESRRRVSPLAPSTGVAPTLPRQISPAPVAAEEAPYVPRGTVGSFLKGLRTPQQALFLGPTLGAQKALQEGRRITLGDIIGGSKEAMGQDLSFRDVASRAGLEGGWATAAGLVGDIVLDPLNLVAAPVKVAAQLGRAARLPQAATKLGLPAAAQAVKETRAAQALGRAFITDFGKPKEYIEAADQLVRNRVKRTERAVDLGKRLDQFSPDDQKKITVFLESTQKGARRDALLKGATEGLETTNKAGDNILDLAREVRRADMSLGDDLVKLGLMSPKTLKAHRGSHIQRMYKEIETNPDFIAKAAKQVGRSLSRPAERKAILTQRKDAEKLKDLTRIQEAAYPVAKGQRQTGELVATREFFNEVRQKFTRKHTSEGLKGTIANAEDAMKKRGFRLIPKDEIYGPLGNKFVPTAIYDDIRRAGQTGVNEWARRWQKGVGWWKYGKIVLNPASHFRNTIGNLVLADMAGLAPWKVHRYVDSMRSLAKKDEFFDLAKEHGTFLSDTFVGHEIPALLNTASSLPQLEAGLRRWGRTKDVAKKIFDKPAKAYQWEEQFFKQAFFIDDLKKTLAKKGKTLKSVSSDDKAAFAKASAAAADEALFNYRKLPQVADKLRRWGVVPFIAFPTKAAAATIKSLGNRPGVMSRYGNIMRAFEPSLREQGKERSALPEYMQENWMRLPENTPIVKNDSGDPLFLNMEYILPWAELGDVAHRARTGKWGEGFFGEGGQEPAFLNIPALKIATTVYSGRDPFTNRLIAEYPGGTGAYYRDQLLPPLAGRQGRELALAVRGERLDPRRTYLPKKTWGNVATGNIFGLRTTARNVDESYARKSIRYANELSSLAGEVTRLRNREVETKREDRVQEDDYEKIMRRHRALMKQIFELQIGRPPREGDMPE